MGLDTFCKSNSRYWEESVDMQKAVLLTEITEVTEPICDHGCTGLVRVTNVIDGTTWQVCVLSFERYIGQALAALDEHARGHWRQ
jgi:hypothetical protein